MGHLHADKETYLQLQRRVDKTQSGLPATPELEQILRHLFTDEEARLGSKLPLIPRSLSSIARRLKLPAATLRTRLDRMADKGLVFDFHHPKRGPFYMLAPPVVGFFEFSLMRVRTDIDQKEVARLLASYLYERPNFIQEIARGGTPVGRTLAHETALPRSQDLLSTEVLDYERASEVLRSSSLGAVSLCYCRHKKQHLGEACQREVEVCLSLNDGADFVLRHGHGRAARPQEMLEILARCREQGLVQIVDNVRRSPTYLCNCCGCCCGQLAALNRFGLTTAVATSGFLATIDPSRCTGCLKCVRTCPIQALALRPRPLHNTKPNAAKMLAKVDADICLGCGVCKPACPQGALSLEPRPQKVLTPEDTLERVLRMALGRGTLHDLLFDEHDGLTSALANRLVGAIERMPLTRRLLFKDELHSRFVAFLCTVARFDSRFPTDVFE